MLKLSKLATRSSTSALNSSVVTPIPACVSLPQLTFQGAGVFTEETNEFTVAITGGTGSFEKARGEVHVQFISEVEERLVIHLFR
jgi:hypothetical protein